MDRLSEAQSPMMRLFEAIGVPLSVPVSSFLLTIMLAVSAALAKALFDSLASRGKRRAPASFGNRLETLFLQLRQATANVDAIMQEMYVVTQQRAAALQQLQQQLTHGTAEEAELKKRIDALRSVSPEAAQVFAREAERLGRPAEQRAKRRDYMLFLMGVVAGGVVSILIEWLK